MAPRPRPKGGRKRLPTTEKRNSYSLCWPSTVQDRLVLLAAAAGMTTSQFGEELIMAAWEAQKDNTQKINGENQ